MLQATNSQPNYIIVLILTSSTFIKIIKKALKNHKESVKKS